MNNKKHIVFGLLLVSFLSYSQSEIPVDSVNLSDSFKQKRIERKTQRETERKNFKQVFRFGIEVANVHVNSSVRFEEPNGIFSAKIDLESHLGLKNEKFIFSGTFIYRITPRSGIYAYYYQINRKSESVLNRDIVFLDDTLKSGTSIYGTQNTNVLSIGYMLSILTEENVFLGMYFNIYMTYINAGIRIEGEEFDKEIGLFTPMPNFGIMATFKFTKWLKLHGGVGLMYLNTQYIAGSLTDANIFLEFTLNKWMGVSLGYYFLDVEVDGPVENSRTYMKYNLNGPTVGLWFRF